MFDLNPKSERERERLPSIIGEQPLIVRIESERERERESSAIGGEDEESMRQRARDRVT